MSKDNGIITRGYRGSASNPSHSTTEKNVQTLHSCEANVLVSLIDGVETRQRCESPWRHIYLTSEKQPKRLCGFHSAFMDFAIGIGAQEVSA
jgi:hypothetical protein